MTTTRLPDSLRLETLAVLPIREYVPVEGLSDKVAAALPRALGRRFPNTQIDGPRTVSSRLVSQNLLASYGQWASTYDMTSIVDKQPLAAIQSALNTRYALFVRSLYLSRERIRAGDAGYSGFVSDANNVWRTDLKISSELIDLGTGQVVWKGVGHAEDINSPRKAMDYGVVIVNQRNPEMIEYVDRLISIATDGLARQLAGTAK